MAKEDHPIRRPPATTPEGREHQLTALAMDAIEKRIRNGTASAQELTYFAKLGSPTSRLERKILEQQCELLEAKTSAIKSQERVEELYVNALSAMRTYSGSPEKVPDYDD
jgi:hypothetical protein